MAVNELSAHSEPDSPVDLDEKDENKDLESNHSILEISDKQLAAAAVQPIPLATTLPPPEPEVDGGLRAWLQVLGSFLAFSNLWGFAFAFGTFQSYYELTYLPHDSASSIAWIGTISTFLLIMCGVISGPLFDLGHFRAMLLVGATLETLAVFLMSVSHTYWQLLLTQGVMMGLVNGLLYTPGIALVSRSFRRRRAIAMGLTTCGAPVGGVIYTLAFQQLITRYSFGWTVRIMGFVMLGSYALSFPLLLWRAKNLGDLAVGGARRKLFDPKALTDPPFWLYTASNFLIFSGYMTPFFFIPSYAQLVLGISQSKALHISMIAQAASIAGRLLAGYTASRIGVMIPWIVCVLSSAVLCLAWIGCRTENSFIAFAALYGCFSGALIPLPPSVFNRVCPDPKVYGARLGMSQALNSVGSLIGAPIAAALASATSTDGTTNYLGLQLYAGAIMTAGGLMLMGLWLILIRRRGSGSRLI